MKELFAYVLECMLTLAKMQNNNTLSDKSLKSETGAFGKLFKLFILYA